MKKLISALLACVMVLSALTAVSFAAELKETTVTRENVFASTVDGVNLSAKPIANDAAPKDFTLNPDQSATWSNIRKSADAIAETRIEATVKDGIKLYKGRKYRFKADLSAADADGKAVSDINMYWMSEDNTFEFDITWRMWADVLSLGESGRKTVSTNTGTAVDDGKITVFRFLNKPLSDKTVVRLATLHSVSADEIITYCDTAFSIGTNGSASIVSYADRDGKNAVSDVALSDGDVKQFEKYSKPSFGVYADEGYVIDSLSFAGSEIAAASGLASYAFAASEISGVSSMNVTFKKKDSAEERKNFAYITLSGNKTFYANEAASANISVKGYDADGAETVLTGSEFLTYTTSNPLVFKVESGVVKSTDKFGMAVITAEYENKDGTKVSASAIFQRSENPKLFTSQSSFEGSHNFFVDLPGHVDGSEKCLAWNGLNDSWQLRVYEGGNNTAAGLNWKSNNHRVITAWFYDDGAAASRPKFSMYYKNYYEKNKTTAFNYTENIGTSSATHYGVEGGNSVVRTKGWHQIVVTIDTRGIKNVYIDGILVKSVQLELNCAGVSDDLTDLKSGASYIEMRSENNKQTPGYLYDDFSIAEYTNIKPEYSVKINAAGGSVNAGGVSVGDGKSAEIIAANGSNLKLSCDNGYKIASVERVDSLGLTEGSNKAVSADASEYDITNISDDLIYNVVVERISSEPSVSANGEIIGSSASFTYTGADGTVTVPDGTLSLIAYATLDSAGAEITECGFEISMYENGVQSGEALKLASYAVPAGNGQYAIRTFGAGIKSGAEYKIRPYITVGENTVYGDYVSKTA